jgi:hypothetical protein
MTPRLRQLIAAIEADPERASYWAENCRWVPGSGYCPGERSDDCGEDCLFRQMRIREQAMIGLTRRQRRP